MGVNKRKVLLGMQVMCGKRFVGGCMRRGREWWNEGKREKEDILGMAAV